MPGTAELVPPPSPVPPAPASLQRLLSVWHRVECWLAVACFGFIAGVLIIDVLGREFLGPVMRSLGFATGAMGLFGSQKLAVFALVIGSFAGIGIATATGTHLVPRVGFGWVPRTWGPTIDRWADVLTGIGLLVVAGYAWKFVMDTKASGALAPVINVSPWPIQLAMPLGFASAALRCFIFAAWPGTRPAAPEFQE